MSAIARGLVLDTELELLIAAGLAILVGAALTIVGLRQRARRLRRNWFVGLRTPSTLRDDVAWRAAHDATAGLVLAAGPFMVAGGHVSLVVRDQTAAAAALLAGVVLGGGVLVLAAVRGHRAAVRAGR